MDELVCIICPIGCRLSVHEEDGGIRVEGNTCPKGEDYGIAEATDPRRTLATTMVVIGGASPLVSIRVDNVPKDKQVEIVRIVNTMSVRAPVAVGDVIERIELDGEGYKIIATAGVDAL